MKLKEIKTANEYLGEDAIKPLYIKDAPENVKQYFGIPLPKNEFNSSLGKKK